MKDFIVMMFTGKNIKPEWEKYRKVFMYLVFGVLTTAVNFISYIVCDKLITGEIILSIFGFKLDVIDIINTFISWVLAVLFAFFTNRAFVFLSKGSIIKELISFFAARLATLIVFEEGTFLLFILILENAFKIPKDTILFAIPLLSFSTFNFTYLYLLKLINCVFVMIANYFLSKLFVFRNKEAKKEVK
ncbi:MAG: GtrA family protein [Clostridia bacterium]|nr:GtrA family protein [Clostridia bacterium]